MGHYTRLDARDTVLVAPYDAPAFAPRVAPPAQFRLMGEAERARWAAELLALVESIRAAVGLPPASALIR